MNADLLTWHSFSSLLHPNFCPACFYGDLENTFTHMHRNYCDTNDEETVAYQFYIRATLQYHRFF